MTKSFRSIKPAATALVALFIFIVAFVAFVLAPLLTVAIVVGSMWGYERYTNSRKQPGIRSLTTPRSLSRDTGVPRDTAEGEQTYGFGSGLGRDL